MITHENRVPVVLACDGVDCVIRLRFTDIPHDLARLIAVNDHGWSHESTPYRKSDFCGVCSMKFGREGNLEVVVDGVTFGV